MKTESEIKSSINPFLDRLDEKADNTGIDMTQYPADHICFRVATIEEYREYLKLFSSWGRLVREAPINGRNIAVFELTNPIKHGRHNIPCVELPEPKQGSPYATGWQHIECVIDEDFESFMRNHSIVTFDTSAIYNKPNPEIAVIFSDNSAVKFHHRPLLEIVDMEEKGLL